MFFGYCQCLTQHNVLFDFYVFTLHQKDQTVHGAVCTFHRCESIVLIYFWYVWWKYCSCAPLRPLLGSSIVVSARKSKSSCSHITVFYQTIKECFYTWQLQNTIHNVYDHLGTLLNERCHTIYCIQSTNHCIGMFRDDDFRWADEHHKVFFFSHF